MAGYDREKCDPRIRLRVAVRDLEPESDPDDFAELVAAVLAFRTLGGALDRRIADVLRVEPDFVHHMANGVITPTPRFRRLAVQSLRDLADELFEKAY